jgi:hypothetical protein
MQIVPPDFSCKIDETCELRYHLPVKASTGWGQTSWEGHTYPVIMLRKILTPVRLSLDDSPHALISV